MLIELLIAVSCANGQYTEACSKALEAGTKQAGIYQTAEKAEDITKQEAVRTVTKVAGAAPAAVIGAAAQGYRGKGITYTFKPTNVFDMDRITTRVEKGSGSLNFGWSF